MSDQEKTNLKAFVLMPFDPEFDAIFEKLIKPSLEEVGYEVTRADSFLNQQNILKDIVRGIAEADLIIADLTSLNVNVFYELGISHTLKKSTVLLSQSSDDIPFDLKPYRVITYSVHFNDAPSLIQKLKEIGVSAKRGNLGFGNPVTDFLPQPNLVTQSYATKTPVHTCNSAIVPISEKAEDTDEEEKGIWDFVVDSETSINEIIRCVDQLSEATNEIGSHFKLGTAEATKIHKEGGPGTASRIRKCASDMAVRINQYAHSLEELQPTLHDSLESYDESTRGILRFTRIFSKTDIDGANKYRSNLEGLQKAIRYCLTGIRGYQEANENMRGISKDINRASKRTTHILDLIIADLEGANSFCTKTMTLLDEKIEKESVS